MKRKLSALALIFALILVLLLPLLTAPAMADMPRIGYQIETYGANGYRAKLVRSDHPDNQQGENRAFNRHFAFRQSTAPSVRVLPDGTVTYPMIVGLKAVRYEADGSTAFEPFPALKPEYKGTDIWVDEGMLYMKIDLRGECNADGEIVVDTSEAIDGHGKFYFSYDSNGGGSANNLSLTLPETPGITVDPASTPTHLILNLEKGIDLPSMKVFNGKTGDMSVGVTDVRGFYSPGSQAETYLPETDAKLLAQYPSLKNTCLLTFMFCYNPNRITHYGIVEGRWKE